MAKYYWLKLEKQFFKRHDIQLLRKEDGRYVEIYMELMTESIDHEGALRFSDSSPYTYDDLADLIGCNLRLFKKAMVAFKRRELIIEDEAGTIWPSLVTERIGSRSESADRTRRYRERKKDSVAEKVDDDTSHVTKSDVTSISVSVSSDTSSSQKENDEVFQTYRKGMADLGLPDLLWVDHHKQHTALKDISAKTRTLAPDSALPDPVEFARGILAVFKRRKETGKGSYWKDASPEPVVLQRRFGELVIGLGDEFERVKDEQAGMDALRRMGKI